MRTLKYAILGLLMQTSVTGYDISKAFGSGLGSFWSAKHSQIYPELKRLTEEGLIQFSTVIQGEKLEKKLYQITDAGKKDFLQWLAMDPPLDPTPKDVFKLRSYYSQWLPEKDYLQLLERQMEKRKEKLSFLEGIMNRSYAGINPATLTGGARGDYIVLLGAIMREQTYVEWLETSYDIVSLWDEQGADVSD